ncbi:MAG: dockerin type I repeat-containing protein [Ruminococcus flavefaciens]|nr:dockerin type I repeat-containing protein [Ruminococcus flavefaciens]MCM1362724.1 dockerin type I repeat-containing protein [Clostridiales bacterium]MCM1436118.1 dockerin type I repeat-containing protein [Ruminococcus flavefaciens]
MKNFKKILSAVSAAVLCALPMINGVAVNAASSEGKLDTYMVFCDVPANSGVMHCDFILYHSAEDQVQSILGNISGGSLNTYSANRVDGTVSYYTQYKANGALSASGTIFKVKVVTGSGAPEIDTPSAFDTNHIFINKKDVVKADLVLIGDVNGDKKVNISDAVLIKQHLSNPKDYPLKEEQFRAADVNYDGVVNDDDALLIQQYEIKLINHF